MIESSSPALARPVTAMRVLFTTLGGAGHLLPLVPFAQACRRAGHEVCVATQASRTAAVERLGLPVRSFGEPGPAEWTPVMERALQVPGREADALVVGELFGRLSTQAALPGLLDI